MAIAEEEEEARGGVICAGVLRRGRSVRPAEPAGVWETEGAAGGHLDEKDALALGGDGAAAALKAPRTAPRFVGSVCCASGVAPSETQPTANRHKGASSLCLQCRKGLALRVLKDASSLSSFFKSLLT
jgi:hypothetical protein